MFAIVHPWQFARQSLQKPALPFFFAVAVEGIADSGQLAIVYTVEVEEHHTDFIGLA